MSEGLPSEDRAVSTFLDYFALACIFGVVDALILGKWKIALGALGAALLFHVVGIKWPRIKLMLGSSLARTANRIAGQPYYRRGFLALIGLLFAAGVSYGIYRHYDSREKQAVVPTQTAPPNQESATATAKSQNQSTQAKSAKKQSPKMKKSNPCEGGTAITLRARGDFQGTKINEGPCDTGIEMLPGSSGTKFKDTEINHGVKPQDNPKPTPPPNQADLEKDRYCNLKDVTFMNYENGRAILWDNDQLKVCNATFINSPDGRLLKPKPPHQPNP
jgi:hypothetical protein